MEPIVGQPVEEAPQVPVPTPLHGYGPKRVKTKEMEIEQFDPRIIAELDDRQNRTLPGFCDTGGMVGRYRGELKPWDY